MYDKLKLQIEALVDYEITLFSRDDLSTSGLNLPEEWQILKTNSYSDTQIINELWKSIPTDGKRIVEVLSQNTIDLMILKPNNEDLPLQLCYVFKMASLDGPKFYFDAWTGGQPSNYSPTSISNEPSKVILPSSYHAFCEIHNGFLICGNPSDGFMPVDKLQMIRYKASNKRLLGFCGNGLADFRCFDLKRTLNENDFETVLFDHESHDIYNRESFWEFAYRFIYEKMVDIPLSDH